MNRKSVVLRSKIIPVVLNADDENYEAKLEKLIADAGPGTAAELVMHGLAEQQDFAEKNVLRISIR